MGLSWWKMPSRQMCSLKYYAQDLQKVCISALDKLLLSHHFKVAYPDICYTLYTTYKYNAFVQYVL